MAESSSNGTKALWKKEKLLVRSNFSFSHSVFKRLVMQTRKNQGLFGKGIYFQFFVLVFKVSSDAMLTDLVKGCVLVIQMLLNLPGDTQPSPMRTRSKHKGDSQSASAKVYIARQNSLPKDKKYTYQNSKHLKITI